MVVVQISGVVERTEKVTSAWNGKKTKTRPLYFSESVLLVKLRQFYTLAFKVLFLKIFVCEIKCYFYCLQKCVK